MMPKSETRTSRSHNRRLNITDDTAPHGGLSPISGREGCAGFDLTGNARRSPVADGSTFRAHSVVDDFSLMWITSDPQHPSGARDLRLQGHYSGNNADSDRFGLVHPKEMESRSSP